MSRSFLNSGTLIVIAQLVKKTFKVNKNASLKVNLIYRENPTKIPVWQKIRQIILQLI
jgi:hypothetical protein